MCVVLENLQMYQSHHTLPRAGSIIYYTTYETNELSIWVIRLRQDTTTRTLLRLYARILIWKNITKQQQQVIIHPSHRNNEYVTVYWKNQCQRVMETCFGETSRDECLTRAAKIVLWWYITFVSTLLYITCIFNCWVWEPYFNICFFRNDWNLYVWWWWWRRPCI